VWYKPVWYKPVIPATQEAETRRSGYEASLGKVSEMVFEKQKDLGHGSSNGMPVRGSEFNLYYNKNNKLKVRHCPLIEHKNKFSANLIHTRCFPSTVPPLHRS
jgi:hypothetical protein